MEATRRGWLAVAAACTAITVLYAAIFAVPPLKPTFTDALGLSNGDVGLLMSVYLIAYASGSLPAGALGDRFGHARVIAAALLVAGLASIAFSFAHDLAPWLVLRGVIGACAALIFSPGIGLAAAGLGPNRASAAAGWVVAFLGVGTTIAFLLTVPLAHALDWRWPFRLYGIACIAGIAPLLPFLATGGRETGGPLVPLADLRRLLERRLLAVAGTLCVGMFVVYGVLTWTTPFLSDTGGFSSGRVTLAGTLLAAVTIPASVFGGWLADRTGRPLLVMSAGLALAVSLLVLAFAGKHTYAVGTVVPMIAAFGVVWGCIPLFALPATLVPPAMAGLAIGTATSFGMAGAVASTYLGGFLVDRTGNYDATWLAVATAAGLAAAVLGPTTARVFRTHARAGRA